MDWARQSCVDEDGGKKEHKSKALRNPCDTHRSMYADHALVTRFQVGLYWYAGTHETSAQTRVLYHAFVCARVRVGKYMNCLTFVSTGVTGTSSRGAAVSAIAKTPHARRKGKEAECADAKKGIYRSLSLLPYSLCCGGKPRCRPLTTSHRVSRYYTRYVALTGSCGNDCSLNTSTMAMRISHTV